MELKLEVVLSSSIKRKKPWPRFCWLGQEKESVFLLDDKRISEINMVSGQTKKKIPKLHPLLNRVVAMAPSQTGTWLAGLLASGELFLWNRDKDLLKTAAAVAEIAHLISTVQGSARRLSLQVSGNGMRVLLAAVTGQVYLWECADIRELTGTRDGAIKGRWAHIQPHEDTVLPSSHDKEATQHNVFVKSEAIGDLCLSAFVFTSEQKLTITFLTIQWVEGLSSTTGAVGYSVLWATKTYPLSSLTPPCRAVKSRGSLVPAFSPDGRLLAVVLNQKDPRATQVLFVSTHDFVSIAKGLGGCGSKKLNIPSKYIRSYWAGSVSWSPNGLFLACVLKRGSLLVLARLGGLLSLSSSGCNVDFGPAHFLPLHPLVTYRPPESSGKAEASLSSSSLSVRDVFRQRFSVTWHPGLFYFIVSDGYMVTVLRAPGKCSPARLITALLREASRDMDKSSQRLDKSRGMVHARTWLETVVFLNLSTSQEEVDPIISPDLANSPAKAFSTLPLFLQDQGAMGDTRELFRKAQAFLEDESDLEGPPAGSHVEEGGILEFASMFDTLHAVPEKLGSLGSISGLQSEHNSDSESDRKTTAAFQKLGKIKAQLLTAWALGLSLGSTVEHREHFLKDTVHHVLRFAALLYLTSRSAVHAGKKASPVSLRVLHLFSSFLTFLPWDATCTGGSNCLGLVVELTQKLVRLLLSPLPDPSRTGDPGCQLSSQNISTALLILRQASDCLDHTYSLKQRHVWDSVPESLLKTAQLRSSDGYFVPLLQETREWKPSLTHQAPVIPHWPSSRLLGVWRWLYRIVLQYVDQLKGYRGCDGWEEEQERLSVISSQIQVALQRTGERLENGPALLSHEGEHCFLLGSYAESAAVWRSELWEEKERNSDRSVYQETRLSLAVLYGLLFQYRLREAQALGDHMVRLVLDSGTHQADDTTYTGEADFWLPGDLHSKAVCAVVQTLGRFMASYFTNQPLYILPPHSVNVLPPLHLPHASDVGRLVPLCQERVAQAVREQHLSDVWTVDYAMDLLLVGGLLPEAVWLANHLGDWKTAASVSLAYTSYRDEHFAGVRLKELRLPAVLEPGGIFQDQLQSLLGIKAGLGESETESLEGEEWELLQVSVREILTASVMAGVDVMSAPLSDLLDAAKSVSASLPALVPNGLYLPAPPLYCPQPAHKTQDPAGAICELAEVASRHKVSGVLQRLMLLLKSARCCRPAAQWYISRLRRARHLQHKINSKYSHPSGAEEERLLPEGLLKSDSRRGYFTTGPGGDGQLDPVSVQTIICFRDLCGLCWMLHVRDQLSLSCRKYQAARHRGRDAQVFNDAEVTSSCVESVRWACRLLPFSRFLNAEEILQDTLLSLLSELPPVTMVADSLVLAFPEEEASVRVPLREKYNSLLRRVKHCTVLGETEERSEVMLVLIQDKSRQRRKDLLRLQRHLAPPERYLWEREEEDDDRDGRQGAALLGRLSLGASLSNSTLTDWGNPPVYSDGDTAENTSEALSPDLSNRITTSRRVTEQEDMQGENTKRAVLKMDKSIQEEGKNNSGPSKERNRQNDPGRPSVPVVGTWEFELKDEEYLCFLELFLTYTLEKESPEGGEAACKPPLLKGYCTQLRERELHSLTFDVLSTLRRRQRDSSPLTRRHAGGDAPMFRAGHCYKPVPQTSSIGSETPMSRTRRSATSSTLGKQQGLFGSRWQFPVSDSKRDQLSERSPNQSAVSWEQTSERSAFDTLAPKDLPVEPQQGLDSKLEAQFPELGRLLEWMMRWANTRSRVGTHGKKRVGEGGVGDGGTSFAGVVIRVKSSTPAVLTALRLLWHRYSSILLGGDFHSARIHVPETQIAVAPLLQPEVGWKLERNSSVDTGYPGSAGTPVTQPGSDVQPEEPSVGFHTEDEERATLQNTPDHDIQIVVNSDSDIGKSTSQPSSLQEPDVAAEQEDHSCHIDSFTALSTLSAVNICGNISSPETSLKLQDLHCSERDGELSSGAFHGSSESEGPNAHMDCDPQAPPSEVPEGEAEPQMSGLTAELTHAAPVATPRLEPECTTTSAAAAAAAAFVTSAAASTRPAEAPATQTEPVRQLVNDELFRLVQLQQINFMSLMHMVGASFANLPFAPQTALLAQSGTNAALPGTPSAVAAPQPNAGQIPPHPHPHALSQPQPQGTFTVPESNSGTSELTPACEPDESALQNSKKISPGGDSDRPSMSGNLHSSINCAEEMQPLSVKAEPLNRGSRRLIPSSEGLLTTIDRTKPIPSIPSEIPPDNTTVNVPASPHVLGLKLLQLDSRQLLQSPVRQAWGPQAEHTGTSGHTHPAHTQYDQAALNRAKERDVSRALFVLPRPQVLNAAQDRPPGRTAHQAVKSDGGLRLLNFGPVPRGPTVFPQIFLPSSGRPLACSPSPSAPPRMQLLHFNPELQMMLPPVAPATHATHFSSLEELSSLAVGSHNAVGAGMKLVNLVTPSESKVTVPCKREKRRNDKMRTGGKAEVTFRANESIIPSQEPIDEPVNVESAAGGEESSSGRSFAIPLGSFDSLLTGQRLLDKAFCTSSELHAFASTQKNPPDSHDACTNTEPAHPPELVDQAISARASLSAVKPESHSSAAVLPPALFVNLRFPRETPVQGPEETSQKTVENQDQKGREFLDVVDLEDAALLREWPALPDALEDWPSSPTSAQLHLAAAAVVCSEAVPPPEEPTAWPDHPGELPLPAPVRTTGDPVTDGVLWDRTGPPDAIGAQEPQSPGLSGAFSTLQAVHFSSQLSEMDAQLAALQRIADHIEMEFANSRMLVKAIETAELKKKITPNKSVSLSVPQKAWRPRSCLNERNASNADEGRQGNHDVHLDSSPPKRHGVFPLPAAAHTAVPSGSDPLSRMTRLLSPETAAILMDNTLGSTGLSDMSDILDELVREGALSPTELELSGSHAAPPNRPERQPRESALQRQDSYDAEGRRELRAWMRKKHRERMCVYQKQRRELRGRESKPYSAVSKSTYKPQATSQKIKEEKDKAMLLDQYNKRTLEACTLITRLPAAAWTLPGAARTDSAPPHPALQPHAAQTSACLKSTHRTRNLSGNEKINFKCELGQTPPDVHPWEEAEVQRGTFFLDNQRRFGLHRPVTSLPTDRLSQVTRRGMLSHMRSRAQLQKARKGEEPHREEARKLGASKSPSRASAAERKTRSEKMEATEKEQREADVANLFGDQEDGARGAASEASWLENLSDSDSFSLSKLDWAAIERMAAAE